MSSAFSCDAWLHLCNGKLHPRSADCNDHVRMKGMKWNAERFQLLQATQLKEMNRWTACARVSPLQFQHPPKKHAPEAPSLPTDPDQTLYFILFLVKIVSKDLSDWTRSDRMKSKMLIFTLMLFKPEITDLFGEKKFWTNINMSSTSKLWLLGRFQNLSWLLIIHTPKHVNKNWLQAQLWIIRPSKNNKLLTDQMLKNSRTSSGARISSRTDQTDQTLPSPKQLWPHSLNRCFDWLGLKPGSPVGSITWRRSERNTCQASLAPFPLVEEGF